MNRSVVRRGWMVLPFLILGVVPAQAQLSNANLSVHFVGAQPMGDFAKFYDAGTGFRLDAGYPMNDFDLVLNLGIDQMRGEATTYIPDTRLWRYQLQIHRDLMKGSETLRFTPFLGVGGTSFRSGAFTPELVGLEQRFRHTYLTGTGGLRIGLAAGNNLVWYLSGELNWSKLAADDTEVLRAAAVRTALDKNGPKALSSATTGVVSIGFNLHPTR